MCVYRTPYINSIYIMPWKERMYLVFWSQHRRLRIVSSHLHSSANLRRHHIECGAWGWARGWRWEGDYVIKGFCGGGWKCSKVEWWRRVWGSWVSTWSTEACALGSLVCCNSSVSMEASRMMLLRINWLQLEVFQLCCMRESLSEPCRLHLEWGPSEKKSR